MQADTGLISGLGRFPGERNGYPLQYSCLKNPMDRGTRWATVHRVAKSWTQLSTHTQLCKVIDLCLVSEVGVDGPGKTDSLRGGHQLGHQHARERRRS